jgi:hypothetical protein
MGSPEAGAECGDAHIGGAKLIRLDDYRQSLLQSQSLNL